MNQVLAQLYARKSVRAFLDREISKEEKTAILRAATEAPADAPQGWK